MAEEHSNEWWAEQCARYKAECVEACVQRDEAAASAYSARAQLVEATIQGAVLKESFDKLQAEHAETVEGRANCQSAYEATHSQLVIALRKNESMRNNLKASLAIVAQWTAKISDGLSAE